MPQAKQWRYLLTQVNLCVVRPGLSGQPFLLQHASLTDESCWPECDSWMHSDQKQGQEQEGEGDKAAPGRQSGWQEQCS